MNKITKSQAKGFTLIELLTVIAIIGILASILIPTVGKVMENARRTQASSNGRQIALAYNTYALDGPRVKNITKGAWSAQNPKRANDVHEWAAVLSVFAGLNDATFWYIGDDDALVDDIPTTVLTGTGTSQTINGDFTSNDAIGWSVVSGLARSAPTSTTPLLWSRGLQSDGTWKAKGDSPSSSSPWGEQGGHIVFLDGHVSWKRTTSEDNTTEGDLVKLSDGAPTKNIEDAVGATGANTEVFNK